MLERVGFTRTRVILETLLVSIPVVQKTGNGCRTYVHRLCPACTNFTWHIVLSLLESDHMVVCAKKIAAQPFKRIAGLNGASPSTPTMC